MDAMEWVKALLPVLVGGLALYRKLVLMQQQSVLDALAQKETKTEIKENLRILREDIKEVQREMLRKESIDDLRARVDKIERKVWPDS